MSYNTKNINPFGIFMLAMQNKRILNSKEQAEVIKALALQSLADDKAEDITLIDLAGKTDFAHYMIVASGRSAKHNSSVAYKLVDRLLEAGFTNINMEGMEKCDWVLIDAVDVIIHIFRPEIRSEYELEKIWNF